MKIDLDIPALNVICNALDTLQQAAAVAKQSIATQVQAAQEAETKAAEEKPKP